MGDISAELDRTIELANGLLSLLPGKQALTSSEITHLDQDIREAGPEAVRNMNNQMEAALKDPKTIAYISLRGAAEKQPLNQETINRIMESAGHLTPEQLQQENRKMLNALPQERRDYIMMREELDKQKGQEPNYASIIKTGTTAAVSDLAGLNKDLRKMTGTQTPTQQPQKSTSPSEPSTAKRPGGKPYYRPDYSRITDSGEFKPEIDSLLRDVKSASRDKMADIVESLKDGYARDTGYYDKLQASIDRVTNQNGQGDAINTRLGQLSGAIDRGRLNEQASKLVGEAFDAAATKSSSSLPNRTNTSQRQAPDRP